jgi:hypothetical protein
MNQIHAEQIPNEVDTSDDLLSYDSVIFYHGTSTYFLDDILQDGLRPRSETETDPNGREDIPNNDDRIYLGPNPESTEDIYGQVMGAAKEKREEVGGAPVILEVAVDPSNLYPDDDMTAYAGLSEDQINSQEFALESIEASGYVSHEGTIPPEDILTWDVKDSRYPPWERALEAAENQEDPTAVAAEYIINNEL